MAKDDEKTDEKVAPEEEVVKDKDVGADSGDADDVISARDAEIQTGASTELPVDDAPDESGSTDELVMPDEGGLRSSDFDAISDAFIMETSRGRGEKALLEVGLEDDGEAPGGEADDTGELPEVVGEVEGEVESAEFEVQEGHLQDDARIDAVSDGGADLLPEDVSSDAVTEAASVEGGDPVAVPEPELEAEPESEPASEAVSPEPAIVPEPAAGREEEDVALPDDIETTRVEDMAVDAGGVVSGRGLLEDDEDFVADDSSVEAASAAEKDEDEKEEEDDEGVDESYVEDAEKVGAAGDVGGESTEGSLQRDIQDLLDLIEADDDDESADEVVAAHEPASHDTAAQVVVDDNAASMWSSTDDITAKAAPDEVVSGEVVSGEVVSEGSGSEGSGSGGGEDGADASVPDDVPMAGLSVPIPVDEGVPVEDDRKDDKDDDKTSVSLAEETIDEVSETGLEPAAGDSPVEDVTAPEQATPEQTAPEPAAPEQTVPEPAAPEQVVPEPASSEAVVASRSRMMVRLFSVMSVLPRLGSVFKRRPAQAGVKGADKAGRSGIPGRLRGVLTIFKERDLIKVFTNPWVIANGGVLVVALSMTFVILSWYEGKTEQIGGALTDISRLKDDTLKEKAHYMKKGVKVEPFIVNEADMLNEMLTGGKADGGGGELDSLLAEAEEAFQAGEYKKALAYYSALASDYGDPDGDGSLLHMRIGECYFHSGMYSESIAELNIALAESASDEDKGNWFRIRYLLAECLMGLGDYDGGRKALFSLVALGGDFPSNLTGLLERSYFSIADSYLTEATGLTIDD